MDKVRIEYKLLHPHARLPTKANADDAGSDLYSVEEVVMGPGETVNVNTGLVFAVPTGYYLTVNGRSSFNKKGILPFRGIIDAGYLGPMMVSLTNTSKSSHVIRVGDRIAQITLHRSLQYEATEVQEFSPSHSMRGERGFGSSGR